MGFGMLELKISSIYQVSSVNILGLVFTVIRASYSANFKVQPMVVPHK